MKSEMVFNRRYRKVRSLGEGTGGQVCLVEDSKMKKRPLALKVFHGEADDLPLFLEEFRTLSSLTHPYLAPVYDLEKFSGEQAKDTFFFTMKFVDGVDLFTATREMQAPERYLLLLKLCYALDYLHRSGLIHGDIKPANILVEKSRQDLRLVDFGLAHAKREGMAESGGTPEFLAPEILDLGEVDARADLYALGITFYKVLVGELPFAGGRVEDILNAHRSGIQLPMDGVSLPATMRAFIEESTQKDPWKRPASLHGIIGALTELCAESTLPAPKAPPLGEARFIGRNEIRRTILENKEPCAFLIRGETGSGRTRLLREIGFQSQLSGKHVTTLSGKSVDADSLLQAWLTTTGELPASEDSLTNWHRATEHFLAAIRSTKASSNGYVLLLDDLDAGEAALETAVAFFLRRLALLQNKHRTTLPPIMIVAAAAETYTPTEEGIWEALALPTFTKEETLLYLQALLGQIKLPSGLEDYLHRFGGGNPLLLRLGLEHLLLSGELTWKAGGYHWGTGRIPDGPPARALAEVYREALALAPQAVLEILRIAALFPAAFNRDEVIDLAGATPAVEAALHWAETHHWLEHRGAAFTFRHEALRLLLHDAVEPAVRAQLHTKIAERLLRKKPKVFEAFANLAYHWKNAGEMRRAREAFEHAAECAETVRNFRANILYLSEARDLTQVAEERIPLDLAIAKNLSGTARYTEAEKILDSLFAAKDLLDADQKIRATTLWVQVNSRRGRYEQAIEGFRRLEKESDDGKKIRDNKTYAQLLGQVASCFIRHGDFADAQKVLQKGLELARVQRDPLTETILECHQGEFSLQRGFLKPAKQLYRRALKRLGQNKKLQSLVRGRFLCASIQNNLAKIATLEGKTEIALRHYQEGLRLSRQLGNPADECISLIHLGNLHYRRSDFKVAEETYSEALDLCHLTQKPREEAMILFNLGNVHFMGGKLQKALDRHGRALRIMLDQQDPSGISNSLAALAIVYFEIGDLGGAEENLDKAEEIVTRCDLAFQRAYVKLLRGISSRLRRDFTRAREFFRVAETQFRGLNLTHERAQTQVEWAEMEVEDRSFTRARELAVEAQQFAREHGAHDLAIQAALVLAALEPEKAKQWLTEAQTTAEEHKYMNLLWRVHAARAERLPQEGVGLHLIHARRILEDCAQGFSEIHARMFWDDRRHQIGSGFTRDTVLGARGLGQEVTVRFRNDSLRVGLQQLSDLFEINMLLSSESNLTTILEILLDTAIKILRAQRGLLLLRQEDGRYEIPCARNFDRTKLDEPTSAFSYSIVTSAIEEKRAVMTNDALSDERFSKERSVNHLKLRSVLCVPLQARNKVFGALYLDNPRRKATFSDEDAKLLEVFSSQAALAFENARLRKELEGRVESQSFQIEEAQRQLKKRYAYDNLIGGASEKTRQLFTLLERIASTSIPILIQGEPGTGKEMLAQTIHVHSPHRNGPFVAQSCAGIPPLLLESILFGHERGAFTEAHEARKGLFEIANGGTVFLSEIGEMSAALQAKLLRVLQEREVRPLGANYLVKTNVRMICAVSQNLSALVEEGKFRRDLFHRLRGIDIHLPALRERREDIPLLVRKFISDVSESRIRLARRTAQLLDQYDWPGNVRELKHVLEAACALAAGREILPDDLPIEIREPQDLPLPKDHLPYLEAKKKFERDYLMELMQEFRGNITRAAAATGLYRQYLHRLLKKHNIN